MYRESHYQQMSYPEIEEISWISNNERCVGFILLRDLDPDQFFCSSIGYSSGKSDVRYLSIDLSVSSYSEKII